MQGHVVDLKRYRATFGERNVTEQIKASIFLEAVLAIEIMCETKMEFRRKRQLWDLKR